MRNAASMNLEAFGRLALASRYLAPKTWSRLSGENMTPAESAEALTNAAIDAGYIAPRAPIPGNTLGAWGRDRKAPLWACRAALALILARGWQPASIEEWAMLAHLHVLNHADCTELAELASQLPAELLEQHRSEALQWLALAQQQEQEHAKRKAK